MCIIIAMDKETPSHVSDKITEKLVNVLESVNRSTEYLCSKDAVTLAEDLFGYYYDENGPHAVRRYTWKNINKIEVQVINYGARIISMKFPDRRGIVDDIVLGFDDIGGYIYYKSYFFGATIGRMTNFVKDGKAKIDKKYFDLRTNTPDFHQQNGGVVGFDQKIWDTHVQDKKVYMSCVSPDGEEGYPGNLMVRIIFELSERNEFHIQMEAFTTKPTIVNLSNLTYLNLAGHHAGADAIYNHILTLNCNCFTKQDENGFCTGEISNVVHTINDFQIPKALGKVMGIIPKDGFNQNFCINRGVHQGDCFVARIMHPPSGRLIELYSNQHGVQFNTANHFGYGHILTMDEILLNESMRSVKAEKTDSFLEPIDPDLKFIDDIHEKMLDLMRDQSTTHYEELRQFIKMLKHSKNKMDVSSENSLKDFVCDDAEALNKIASSPKQIYFLRLVKKSIEELETEEHENEWLIDIVDRIIHHGEHVQTREKELTSERSETSDTDVANNNNTPPPTPEIKEEKIIKIPEVSPGLKLRSRKSNVIPTYYKHTKQIVGKERKLYQAHGGIALQTQNYPNCANIDSFPSCVLRPGEKYSHTITYKFWVRSGNPNRWIKRNMHEINQVKKNVL